MARNRGIVLYCAFNRIYIDPTTITLVAPCKNRTPVIIQGKPYGAYVAVETGGGGHWKEPHENISQAKARAEILAELSGLHAVATPAAGQ